MIEKIIVGLVMAGAVVGLVMWIRREQQPGRCEGGCEECPLMGSGCSGNSGDSGKSGESGSFGENEKEENEKD